MRGDDFYAALASAVTRAYRLRRWAERGKNPFGYLNPIEGLDGNAEAT